MRVGRREVWLLLVTAGLATPAISAEPLAKGMSVVRELADAHGHRFAITFTPPADRAIDSRVMDGFEISISTEMSGGGASGEKQAGNLDSMARGMIAKAAAHKSAMQAEADAEADAVDVSGYGITVQALSLPACSAKITIAKTKPSNLAKGAFVFVRATDGPASMTAVAYPTSGDVDTGIGINDTTVCDDSEKAKGNLDVASCTNSACNAARDVVTGIIINPTNSTAKFVGAFSIVYSN